jgi:hypothetical protein
MNLSINVGIKSKLHLEGGALGRNNEGFTVCEVSVQKYRQDGCGCLEDLPDPNQYSDCTRSTVGAIARPPQLTSPNRAGVTVRLRGAPDGMRGLPSVSVEMNAGSTDSRSSTLSLPT